ncbi:hypothetical protein [Rhabdaerophilum sp. SD176]|uniref:hypothetical protein n=1 Tax=Rhabdaerophilum sp. SD176 TaxID=2983548 RepID=UPI0024DFC61B|nr:hypothetical protein [Rhabdaerophilum sp. SD176]
MIQNISSNAAVNPAAALAASGQQNNAGGNAAAKQEKTVTKKAVPALSELDAKAWMLRQQVGAALYDRSFTLREGERALKRMEAIEAYANEIFAKEGGPTDRDLRRLANKLNNADKLLDRLSTNDRGINLSSLEGIDGRDIDVVQANLADRIRHGLKDGSLTEDEAKVLVAQQDQLAELETKFRESDGKLTAGEMKQVMDQLRKSADALNQARNNGVGVNLGTYSYADAVNDRQAQLDKMLADGLKAGSLTETEAETVRNQFAVVNEEEAAALKNGKVDWREWVNLSTSMNDAEILIYDLQRNDDGKRLADSYVDVVHVDKRQAQQLEGLTRGIDNGALTNEEAISLLDLQQDIQRSENKLVRDGLTRSEFLRLQNEMNDYSLVAADLQSNSDRYDGVTPRITVPPVLPPVTDPVTPPAGPAPVEPAAPAVVAVDPAPEAPVAPPVIPNEAPPATGNTDTAAPETDEAEASATPAATKGDESLLSAGAQEALKRAASSYGEIRDRFAEFMTKAMADSDRRVIDRVSEYLDKAAERRKEEGERVENASDDRKVGVFGKSMPDSDTAFGPGERGRDVAAEAKVGAYLAGVKPTVVTVQDKIV